MGVHHLLRLCGPSPPLVATASDRRNMRFEFFHYDPKSYDTFEYYQTVDMSLSLGTSLL
jgi:hypothetical protein